MEETSWSFLFHLILLTEIPPTVIPLFPHSPAPSVDKMAQQTPQVRILAWFLKVCFIVHMKESQFLPSS